MSAAAPRWILFPRVNRRDVDGHRLRGTYVPLLLTMSWSVATIVLFAWGPFKYYVPNPVKLYVYLAFAQAAIVAGYVIGARKNPRMYGLGVPVATVMRVCVVASLIYVVVSLPIAPGQWLQTIRGAFRDPDLARTLFISTLGTWREYAAMAFAPFMAAVIPLGIVFWKRIGWFERIGAVFLFLIPVGRSLASASRHGLWQLMIVVAASLIVAHYGRTMRIPKSVAIAFLLCAVAGFTFYANFIAVARVPIGSNQAYGWTLSGSWVDERNLLYRLPPERLRPAFIEGIAYFTHGYRGLSIAMDLPFRGVTFGVGNSMFLTRNAARVMRSDAIYRISLPYRVTGEEGYSEAWWMTAYPWIAADVTFPGSILVLFFAGWLMATTFLEARDAKNPFALILFTWMVYFMFSLPQGSITQDGSVVIALATTFVLWRFSLLRLVIRGQGNALGPYEIPGYSAT